MVVRSLLVSVSLLWASGCLYIPEEEHNARLEPEESDTEPLVTDADGDGFDGLAHGGDDCDDDNAAVNPEAAELCNEVDDDCDGEVDVDATDAGAWYADTDGDGFGDGEVSVSACVAPEGHVADGTDCDDGAAGVHPGAAEVCNEIDDDCNGDIDAADAGVTDADPWFTDGDLDGFGAAPAGLGCGEPPQGTSAVEGDCDDLDNLVNPAAAEVCNGADDDCDGLADDVDPKLVATSMAYADDDGDGFGASDGVARPYCVLPNGFVENNADCDDAEDAVNPDAEEVCNEGVDDDCNGLADAADLGVRNPMTFYFDGDNDGYGYGEGVIGCGHPPPNRAMFDGDCNDLDPNVNPAAEEVCNNGQDENCDAAWDECALEPAIDLGLRDAAFQGITTNARVDAPVIGFDFNGDNINDLAVGSPEYHGGAFPPNAGAVFVFFGPVDPEDLGPADVVISSLRTPPMPSQQRFLGLRVAAVPDVDGDGRDEIVIGAYLTNGGTGRVYVVYGRDHTGPDPLLLDVDGGDAALTLVGRPPEDDSGGTPRSARLGAWVAGSRDLNGDDRPDIVVGDVYEENHPLSSIWVIDGALTGTHLVEAQGHRIEGGVAAQRIGGAFDVGDLDMDGEDDLVLGAYGQGGNRGCVHLIRGPLPPTGERILGTSADWIVCSPTPGDYFGQSVHIAGDVDGDEANDLVVSSLGHRVVWLPVPSVNHGVVHLYSGAGFRGVQPITKLPEEVHAAALLRVKGYEGVANAAAFGTTLYARGDIDGDGLADIAAGSPLGNVGATNNVEDGYAVLMSSTWINSRESVHHDLALLPEGEGLYRFIGNRHGSVSPRRAGARVMMGDVDGDGRDDLLVTERQGNSVGGAANQGRLHIFPGWSW